MCYIFNEQTMKFKPMALNSRVKFIRDSKGPPPRPPCTNNSSHTNATVNCTNASIIESWAPFGGAGVPSGQDELWWMVQCSMVAAACSDESVEGMGLASDTCYQVMGEVAQGVTECASSGKKKETVTTECKVAVFSLIQAKCPDPSGPGYGEGQVAAPDPGTVLSPFDIISPDDAKTKCDNANINNAVVSLLKSKSLTKVACPFGVPVVGHKDFPTGYVLYAANVLARLLDKNQDGAVDDAAVLKGLKTDYKTIAIGGISQATEDVPMDDDWITFGLQVWKGPDDVVVAKRILVEEIFHMVTQWGWGIAYPSDVGSNDFTTSIACREMMRVACCNPGWMHPENRCPGAVGSADDYYFPADHTYRVPGSSDNLAPVYPITREILPKLQGSVLQLGV